MCGISPWFFFEAVTVFDASLVAGKHSNIYSECTEKSGVNYMLDNLRKVDILQLSNFLRSKSKDI